MCIRDRVSAWAGGEEWKLERFRDGADVYMEAASVALGRPVTDKADPGRQVGKTAELAFGYQGGVGAWRRFDKSDNHTDDEVNGYKLAWRDKHGGITALWDTCNDTTIRVVASGITQWQEAGPFAYRMQGSFLECRLPTGRSIWYYSPKVEESEMPWSTPDNVVMRPGVCYWATKTTPGHGSHWMKVRGYGGMFFQNGIQAISCEAMVYAMWGCRRENIPVVLTVHDELLTEVKEGDEDLDRLSELVTQPVPGLDGLPIAAAGWVGKRYRKD